MATNKSISLINLFRSGSISSSCKYAATRKTFARILDTLLAWSFFQGLVINSNHVYWKSSLAQLYVTVLTLLFFAGGFIHGLNNLTYGIYVEKIRFVGILQVHIYNFFFKFLHLLRVLISSFLGLFSENSDSILCCCTVRDLV